MASICPSTAAAAAASLNCSRPLPPIDDMAKVESMRSTLAFGCVAVMRRFLKSSNAESIALCMFLSITHPLPTSAACGPSTGR